MGTKNISSTLIQELSFKSVNGPTWRTYTPEIAKSGDGKIYHKNGDHVYIESGDEFKCVDCNDTVMAATVHHSIHDGPFPLSGSGSVKNESVPYCPTCEEIPNSSGSFINQ